MVSLNLITTTQRGMSILILQRRKLSLQAGMCPEPWLSPHLNVSRGCGWVRRGSHCSQLLPQCLQEAVQPRPSQAGQQQVGG